MSKKRTKRIIQFVLLTGTVISLFFVPWILVKAWILPLPDTVQEQLEEAVDEGFAGIIVYVDQAGRPPAFFAPPLARLYTCAVKIPRRELSGAAGEPSGAIG